MPKLRLVKEGKENGKPEQQKGEVPKVRPERRPEVEVAPEKELKEEEKVVEEKVVEETEKPTVAPSQAVSVVPAEEKSETLAAIEKVLEEDILDYYHDMPPEKQRKFKEKGEETASKIEKLLSKTKIQVEKVFSLIKSWLKIIPGVNKLFLEKKAKIKADKILAIKKSEQEEAQK